MLKKEKYLEILMKNISNLVDKEKFFMDIFFSTIFTVISDSHPNLLNFFLRIWPQQSLIYYIIYRDTYFSTTNHY